MCSRLVIPTQAFRTQGQRVVQRRQRFIVPSKTPEAVGEEDLEVGISHHIAYFAKIPDRLAHRVDALLVARDSCDPSQRVTREVQRLWELVLLRQCKLFLGQLANRFRIRSHDQHRRYLMAQRLRHTKRPAVLLRVEYCIAERGERLLDISGYGERP